jgi:maleylpyruvate isomerase
MTTLYSYFRSSASYRVRIALNIKGVAYETAAVHLLNQGGEQLLPAFTQLNPHALVPVLADRGKLLAVDGDAGVSGRALSDAIAAAG